MNRNRIWIVFFILVVAVFIAGCQEKEATVPFQGVDVNVYAVKTQGIEANERFYGEVQSKQSVTITATVGGTIEKVNVHNGKYVNEGDVLFSLHNSDILSSVDQAKSALSVAHANLTKIQSGATQEEIEAMEQNVYSAQVAFESAKTQYERIEVLYQNEAVSLQQYQQAQSEMEMAEARLKSLQHQFNQMKNGPSPETIRVHQAQVEQAQAFYQAALRKLEELTITSPISGYISNVSMDRGEWVAVGMPLATVDFLDQVYVEIQVPETIFTQLEVGRKTDVHISSLNESFDGKVVELNPRASEQSKLFLVKVEIANVDQRLKPGMTGKVSVVMDDKKDVLAVPVNAVIHDQGEIYVYVVEDSVARRKYIQIGNESDGWIEVTEGLKENDQVIVRGQDQVSDGVKVNVLKQSTP